MNESICPICNNIFQLSCKDHIWIYSDSSYSIHYNGFIFDYYIHGEYYFYKEVESYFKKREPFFSKEPISANKALTIIKKLTLFL